MKAILGLVALVGIVGCGIDKGIGTSYDSTTRQHQLKNEKLLETFGQVVGT